MTGRIPIDLAEMRDDPDRAVGISKLSTLIKGRRHTRESVIHPRNKEQKPIPFIWVVLGGREYQETLGGAVARFKALDIPSEMRSYQDLADEVVWQVIARAMRDIDDKGTDLHPYPKPLGTVDEVRDALTRDERDILMTEYADLEEEVDPDPALQSEQWHREINAALKKSPEIAMQELSNFGSRTLIGYLVTTVRPQFISRTSRSEFGGLDTSSGSKTADPQPQQPSEKG